MVTRIFYHKRTKTFDCPDGIAAAFVASLKYPKAKITGCIYQTDPPSVEDGDTIIIVDFSFPIATLNHWRDRGCHILLIDHHKTLVDHVTEDALNLLTRSLSQAISQSTQQRTLAADLDLTIVEVSKLQALLDDRTSEAYQKYPQILRDFLDTAVLTSKGAIALADYIGDRSVPELFKYVSGGVLSFDISKCGAVLAWEYFFPDQPVPAFLYYIQDRDLFNHALPYTEEIHEVFGYLERKFNVFRELMPLSQEELIEKYQLLGATLLAPKRRKIAELSKNVRWQKIRGHCVLTVELTTLNSGLASDVCYHLYTTYPHTPFVVTYTWREDEQRYKLSFRSAQDSILDLSEFAGYWGGGGHFHAAGASMEHLPWDIGEATI